MACRDHAAEEPQPDACFACKMGYMRERGSPIVTIPKHFDTSSPSARYQRQEMYADARRKGTDLQKV